MSEEVMPWGLPISDADMDRLYEGSKRDAMPVGSEVRQLIGEVRFYRQQSTRPSQPAVAREEVIAEAAKRVCVVLWGRERDPWETPIWDQCYAIARAALATLAREPLSSAADGGVNCFGILDRYKGWIIKQGPDDRFYADAPSDAATWEELRDEIDLWEGRNAR